MVRTNLELKDVKPKMKDLLEVMFKNIPSGVGIGARIKVSKTELRELLEKGAAWAVEKGYGYRWDLDVLEEGGCLKNAKADAISPKSLERGVGQVGCLGSGNHFLEVQVVDKIFNPEVAKVFGITKEGQVTVMIHTGSRGFGHQVCTDFLREMEQKYHDLVAKLPDRELVYAPAGSELCERYIQAMSAAANFAWCNRQMIVHWVRESFAQVMKQKQEDLGMEIVYDVAHNIAKIEEHEIDGRMRKVYTHRKGATRCFPAGHKDVPARYRSVGHPVLIPGSMGTASYVMVGNPAAMENTFGSTCFIGDTKVLTNKGLLKIKELYEKFKNGEEILALSINEKTMKAEWKKISDAMKRGGDVVRISVSQWGRKKENTLDLTLDHKMLTFDGLELSHKKIEDILSDNEMICILDKIPSIKNLDEEKMAYVAGAIFSDGYTRNDGRHGQVSFIQKPSQDKLEFIEYVCSNFEDIFNVPLADKGPKPTGGGIINGRQIYGSGNEFRCAQKLPSQTLIDIRERVSEWVLNLDDESVKNYLAGIIDGDGTYNKSNNAIQIFTGKEKIIDSIILACLRLGIVPYVSQNRTCLNVHIAENKDILVEKTKRVKGSSRKRKYGTKLFAARQLFDSLGLSWPFKQKIARNNFMSREVILRHLDKFKIDDMERVKKILDSDLRMLRVKQIEELGEKEVYNITVDDNHNYIVFTSHYTPVLVKNCHGAGREMSRTAAINRFWGQTVVNELKNKGILVKAASWKGVSEEAPQAYKNIDEVVEVTEKAGISNRVARLVPIGVVKG